MTDPRVPQLSQASVTLFTAVVELVDHLPSPMFHDSASTSETLDAVNARYSELVSEYESSLADFDFQGDDPRLVLAVNSALATHTAALQTMMKVAAMLPEEAQLASPRWQSMTHHVGDFGPLHLSPGGVAAMLNFQARFLWEAAFQVQAGSLAAAASCLLVIAEGIQTLVNEGESAALDADLT